MVLLVCFVPHAAHAQLSADSLSLARAVAGLIGQMRLDEAERPVLLLPAATPFDSAVNVALREQGRFRNDVRALHPLRIGTRGVVVLRDTAELHRLSRQGIVRDSAGALRPGTRVAVVVEQSGSHPEDGSGLTSWGSRVAHLFTRTSEGWSHAGAKELSTWDGGAVRDEIDPRRLRVRKDGG